MSKFPVPAEGWAKLDEQQKEKINNILRSSTLMSEGDQITPDDSIKMSEVDGNVPDSLCTIACDIAQTVAMSACDSLDEPARGICRIAAKAAGDACRDAC